MIDTILFDLDGTLLKVSQDAFVGAYFAELGRVFTRLGMNAEMSTKALWAGTKAMMQGDGRKPNADRFWETFAEHTGLSGEELGRIEAACNSFYVNEFHAVKSVTEPSDIPKRLVCAMRPKGYTVVLATNPLFPASAVATRLEWIGLAPSDFELVTHYENSSYCKPNPGYFREIYAKINKRPEQCLMAGNHPIEDMAAGALGSETFLVTDCLENAEGADVTGFRRGTLAELETYLMAMPDIA